MKNRFLEWSKKKYTEKDIIITLIFLAPIFLVIIPLTLLLASGCIDRLLGIPRFLSGPLNLIIVVFLIIIGLVFALWSIQAQFDIGKGTPVPMMPTKKLVIVGPFLYCRNPMTFGTMLLYLGVSFLIGSLSSIGLVFLMALALMAYIKLIEEKELIMRFGEEYLDYKKRTPFIIPKIK
jgi:protein-S-isoprenylcysteine O-methyltransferase Ste14